jgi:hypothetical protein
MLQHCNTFEVNLNIVLPGLHDCAVYMPHSETYLVLSSVLIFYVFNAELFLNQEL